MLSQDFYPMGAQLLLKAVLLLAERIAWGLRIPFPSHGREIVVVILGLADVRDLQHTQKMSLDKMKTGNINAAD